MAFVNPLYYPFSILAGTVSLVIGVQVLNAPSMTVVPVAIAVSTAGAFYQKSREPVVWDLQDPNLARELQFAKQQAEGLAYRAEQLRAEVAERLTTVDSIDVLVAIQSLCDQLKRIPDRVEQMAQHFQAGQEILSIDSLQTQITEVRTRAAISPALTQQQLETLAQQLERNLALAQQGQDARQAQVTQLSTRIVEAAGILQTMQTQLQSGHPNSDTTLNSLRNLSDQLSSFEAMLSVMTA